MPTCSRIASTTHSAKKSKAMIRELGNVELFELCENMSKVQCSHRLLHWNQGIVYCTCGQCLIDSESRRKLNKLRLAALSVPNYVIKKGPTLGTRHGKTELQREYHLAWNAWKRRCKKVDSRGEQFTGIHDRFLRDPVHRESQLAIGWTEQRRKEKIPRTLVSCSEQSRQNGPVKLRSDFRVAVLMKNRLHHESGEQIEELLHTDQQRRWHSSSCTSWWDRIGSELIIFWIVQILFLSQLVSFKVDGDPL